MPGQVPPEFAEMFSGIPEEQLKEQLLAWMDRRYGSSRAYLYWLVQLASTADRETVRLEAVRFMVTLFHGERPQEVIVTAKKVVETHGSPAELTPPGTAAELIRVLSAVGAIPAAARALRSGETSDATLESVPGAHP